jgi:hypothetical protein
VAAVAATAVTAAGCGIRGTSVPVDAGAAPSRASCRVTGAEGRVPDPADAAGVQVFLVCGTQILAVERTVHVPRTALGKDLLWTARALLGELQTTLTAAEEEAGFTTEVPAALRVAGAHANDPEGTLRLSRAPDELPAPALAQVVCTLSGRGTADGDDSVVLGGPGGEAPQRFGCTENLRMQPEVAPPVGRPVLES